MLIVELIDVKLCICPYRNNVITYLQLVYDLSPWLYHPCLSPLWKKQFLFIEKNTPIDEVMTTLV